MFRLLVLLLCFASPALAEDRYYVGVMFGSQHVGSDEFNDFNPGLTFGRRRSLGDGGVEWHIEGGVFYNSYREISPILVTGLSTPLAQIGPGELRLGASVGTAYYRELSDILERENDFPNVAGFLPIAAITTSYRVDKIDYRMSILPYGQDVKAVLNFSIAAQF